MKRLIVCCDGTWNVADPTDGSPTNVVRIAMNVAPSGGGVDQRVYYHSGVGTGPVGRFVGGAFGVGLSDLVLHAYRFLVATWEPGDELFLFGFSRGAFTVRSLGGLIRNSGIVRPEHADQVEAAYQLYRSRMPSDEPEGRAAALFRATWAREAEVRCIGVFDTVGALGVPFTGNAAGEWINQRWAFHDTRLGPHVRSAFHGLAIDERRGPFTPSLWTEATANQEVKQVWFRGCHSDIGGGLQDPDLADVTLRWMVTQAESCGLSFRPGAFQACATPADEARSSGACIRPDPAGAQHDSGGGLWFMAGLTDRTFGDPEEGLRPGEAIASTVAGTTPPLPSTFRADPPGPIEKIDL